MQDQYQAWWRGLDDPRSASVSAFARYLGISQPTVNNWLQGAYVPSGDNVEVLARKLGPGIYDALGLAHDDSRMGQIRAVYDNVPESERNGLVEAVHDWAKARGYTVAGNGRRD